VKIISSIFKVNLFEKLFWKDLYSSILPFADFDIIDEQFNKDFDKLYSEKEISKYHWNWKVFKEC
jgi:hypothetical protein